MLKCSKELTIYAGEKKRRASDDALSVSVLVVASMAAAVGCGSQLDLAPEATTVPREWILVSSPPPPALPEEIPIEDNSHSDEALWTDGCWQWSVGRWVWIRGGWVKSPQDATYFPGKLAIAPDGRLFWKPCTWMLREEPIGFLEPETPALYPPTQRTVQH